MNADSDHMAFPVLYCACSRPEAVPDPTRRALADGLKTCGRPVTVVPDLCALAARRDPLLKDIAAAGRATVIACHPRAVRWLFDWAGAPLDPGRIEMLSPRTASTDAILAVVSAPVPCGVGLPPQSRDEPRPVARSADSPRAWFPVIDYDRCTNCRQCLEFCLFGVYETDPDGRVVVRHPDQCKDNCPACARMCPRVAIMFPKIAEESPVSGNLDDAAQAAGKVRLTREQLFGDNVLDTLRARRRPARLLKPELYDEPKNKA